MNCESGKIENFETINVLDELEKELKILLDNELYISALMVALTIPDFMGNIAYPNTNTSYHYIEWFNNNFVDFMGNIPNKHPFRNMGAPNLNGKLCYALRCKLLHEGHDDLKEDLNIDEFVLAREKEGFVRGHNGGTEDDLVRTEDGQLGIILTNYQYISIREIVNGLLKGATNYRKKHNIEEQLTRLKVNDGGGKVSNIFSTDYYKLLKKK